jgi:hypothetical protein
MIKYDCNGFTLCLSFYGIPLLVKTRTLLIKKVQIQPLVKFILTLNGIPSLLKGGRLFNRSKTTNIIFYLYGILSLLKKGRNFSEIIKDDHKPPFSASPYGIPSPCERGEIIKQ